MRLFCVCLTGRGLQLRMEDVAAIDAGFVKNEFVLANSEVEASKRAAQQVRAELQQEAAAGGLLLKDLDIKVDEIAPSLRFWKLLQREGFIFFPEHDTSG